MNLDQSFSILFWLNKCKANSKGLAPIYVRITVDGKRAECSTSKSIKSEHWNSNKGLPEPNYYLAKPISEYLRQTEVEINRHFNILLSTTEYVTAEDVKRSYKGTKESHKSLLQLFTQYIRKLEERRDKNDLSAGRCKHFATLKSKCDLFMKERFKKSDVLLKDLKLSFIEEFYHYLRTVQTINTNGTERVIAQNTAMKYCKQLKQVLDYAAKFEYVATNPFQYYKCSYKRPKRTYLSQTELDLLHAKDMPIARLEEVKDCYLFCCYTGYAYSDAVDLSTKDLGIGMDGKKWILRDRIKTENQENVPLLPAALEIIEKYKNHPYCIRAMKLLPMNSNQRYNGYLKEVADIAGIKKKLTSHTARHTFATTVTLTNGVPLETVSKMLGHDDIRTTQIYAEIVDAKVSEDMILLSEKLAQRQSSQPSDQLSKVVIR